MDICLLLFWQGALTLIANKNLNENATKLTTLDLHFIIFTLHFYQRLAPVIKIALC
jgi:hypothetical protein